MTEEENLLKLVAELQSENGQLQNFKNKDKDIATLTAQITQITASLERTQQLSNLQDDINALTDAIAGRTRALYVNSVATVVVGVLVAFIFWILHSLPD